jgi:hypothetical protein
MDAHLCERWTAQLCLKQGVKSVADYLYFIDYYPLKPIEIQLMGVTASTLVL